MNRAFQAQYRVPAAADNEDEEASQFVYKNEFDNCTMDTKSERIVRFKMQSW